MKAFSDYMRQNEIPADHFGIAEAAFNAGMTRAAEICVEISEPNYDLPQNNFTELTRKTGEMYAASILKAKGKP